MADANDGRVPCWYDGEFLLTGTDRPFDDPRWKPYIARPRADDDARERRIRADESRAWIDILREYAVLLGIDTTREGSEPGQLQILHAIQDVQRDRDEWKARATKAEAEVALLRARIDAESAKRDTGAEGDQTRGAGE